MLVVHLKEKMLPPAIKENTKYKDIFMTKNHTETQPNQSPKNVFMK
jgi:hypothetical protein